MKKGQGRRGFEYYDPSPKTRKMLDQVLEILDEYQAYWPLTQRQIFYRLVAEYGAPKTDAFAKNTTVQINKARRAGMIPFEAIRSERGQERIPREPGDTPPTAETFVREWLEVPPRVSVHPNMWQPQNVVLWCEAAGTYSVIQDLAGEYGFGAYTGGGFDSLTAKYRVARWVAEAIKPTLLLHIGDFDPSGVALFEVLVEDITAFAEEWGADEKITAIRVALTPDQILERNIVTAPPKPTDTNTRRFVAEWGVETAQLEALRPDEVSDVLEAAIKEHIDLDARQRVKEYRKAEQDRLDKMYGKVRGLIADALEEFDDEENQ